MFKIIILFLSFYITSIYCVTIGSDTAVNRFNTQQVLNNGDRIAGFAALEGGFSLASMDTTGTFDSIFPVSGNVELVGGTLILNQDLVFSEVANFVTLGNVTGNNHFMELAASMTCLPLANSSISFADCAISLLTSVAQAADVNTVSWSYDDQYVAIGLDNNGGAELLVYEFDGLSLTLIDSLSLGDTVYDVDWHPSQYFLAVGRDSSGGTDLRVYSFNGVTLTEISGVERGSDVTAVSYNATGEYLMTGGNDNNPELILYPVNGDGTLDTGGAVSINLVGNPDVQPQAIDWDVTGTYVAIGLTPSGANAELLVYQIGFSPLSLTLNASVEYGDSVNAVSWNSTYPNILAVGLDSLSPLLRILSHNPGAGTLTSVVTESTNLATPIRILDWRQGGQCLALGKDTGAGGELRTYRYNNAAATLTIDNDIGYASSVRGVKWSHSGQYLAVGSDTNILEIYSVLSSVLDSCVTFSDLNLILDCNTCFQDCCIKFGGNSVINGQGMVLDISPTCTVIVDQSASLLMKNLIITGVSGNKLSATDSTSTYSFQDVQMFLSSNYSFTVGKFDVVGDFEIIGNGKTFIYSTDQISTISRCGRMLLDTGITFSYDPPVASQVLFQLADNTAEFWLNSATLHTTGTGLRLTKGQLVIDGNSFLSAQSSVAGLGISFGDGVSAANNLCIEILPAATLQVLSGLVENYNV